MVSISISISPTQQSMVNILSINLLLVTIDYKRFSLYTDVRGGDKQHVELFNDEPISYDINFKAWGEVVSTLSRRESASDWDANYNVLDYTKYADTFDGFADKYPCFTLVTDGKAESDETFGNPGAGKFGTKTFPTKYFGEKRANKSFVQETMDHKFFTVWANIGVGFQRKDVNLYVFPFYNVGMNSFGAYNRYIYYGLTVDKITFYPKGHKDIACEPQSYDVVTEYNNSSAQ